MTASARHAALLLVSAAAVSVAAACSQSPSGPSGPEGARALIAPVTGTTSPAPSTTCSDSVQAGYGTCATGGIEYHHFEYDPETGTETVVTTDPEACSKYLTYQSSTCDPDR